MKSKNRLAYCSGCTVEISAVVPCLTVLAACAVRLRKPNCVNTSTKPIKYISRFGLSINIKTQLRNTSKQNSKLKN